jgi:type IV secretion system protein TrbL
VISHQSNDRFFYSVALVLVLCVVVVGFFQPTQAQQIFDTLLDGYRTNSIRWYDRLLSSANRLFWLLATIELAWSAITWVLGKDNLSSFTAAMVKKIMAIGFFYMLILYANAWIPTIIDSFKQAGSNAASGGTAIPSPSNVFDTGVDIASLMLQGLKDMSLFSSLPTMIIAGWAALLIVGAFAWIAIQLLVTLVESYIVVSAGVLFLGFGGSRWTTELAQRYISYAVSIGVKLFVIYLIIGLGYNEALTWRDLVQDSDMLNNNNILAVFGGSLLLAYLATRIPTVAASMIAGSSNLTAGGLVETGGIAAAASMAAGLRILTSAYNAGRNVVTQPAGVMSAVQAASLHSTTQQAAGFSQTSTARVLAGTAWQNATANTVGGRLAAGISQQTQRLQSGNASAGATVAGPGSGQSGTAGASTGTGAPAHPSPPPPSTTPAPSSSAPPVSTSDGAGGPSSAMGSTPSASATPSAPATASAGQPAASSAAPPTVQGSRGPHYVPPPVATGSASSTVTPATGATPSLSVTPSTPAATSTGQPATPSQPGAATPPAQPSRGPHYVPPPSAPSSAAPLAQGTRGRHYVPPPPVSASRGVGDRLRAATDRVRPPLIPQDGAFPHMHQAKGKVTPMVTGN